MLHHRAIILIGLIIGSFSSALLTVPCFAQGDESNSTGLVEVEPTFVAESRVEGKYELVPYAERRGKWGTQFGLGYSMFAPTNFQSEFLVDDFDFIYGGAEMPLLELLITLKRNFSFGAIGLDIAAGFYQNTSDTDLIETGLEIIPIRIGAGIYLDRLFKYPYIVPYASVGGYMAIYKENFKGEKDAGGNIQNAGTNEFGGNTQIAPYVAVGAQFSLDWIDPLAARVSYEESGIQGTFIFVEGRKYFAGTGHGDPDFETAFDPSAGLRVEF